MKWRFDERLQDKEVEKEAVMTENGDGEEDNSEHCDNGDGKR